MLKNIEFNGLPTGEVEIRMENTPVFELKSSDRDFIQSYIELLKAKRPKAYEALKLRYSKSSLRKDYYEFLIVRGDIKCNFLIHDNHYDIDENENFVTEFFLCPKIGECHEYGIICSAPVRCDLSEREIDILRLIVQGYENMQIADTLYLSVNTIHNHRNNILKKTFSRNTADMVRYWYESNLK